MKIRNQNAFSLIEVIIVVAITSVVFLLFGSLFFGSWADYEATLSRVGMQEKMDTFFAVLEEDVMEADSFTIGNGGQQLTLTQPASANFNYSTIVYDFTGGQIIRTATGTSGGVQTLVARGVQAASNFSIDVTVANVLVCQVTIFEQVFGRPVTIEGTKRLGIRN